MNRFIPSLLGSLLGALLGIAGPAQAAPRVLLVGIDGAQYQRMQELSLPSFASLQTTRAYTGGITGASSEAATLSGPGWTSILTGVWADKHGVTSNSSGRADAKFPSLFRRVREARPQAYIASLSSWAPINTQFLPHEVTGNDYVVSGRSDADTVSLAVDVIRTKPSDLLFVHLSDPDNVGHSHCFGAAYDRALQEADRRLGTLLNEVHARARNGDDWLVLVTTDHGRSPPRGCHHSDQTRQEKEIFIASNRPMNAEFHSPLAAPDQGFNGLYDHAAQTSIAPTVLRHLGIELRPEWSLDGIPLVGSLGVRKLMGDHAQPGLLRWNGAGDAPVSIWRNGSRIAQVPLGQKTWTDPAPPAGTNDYTLVVDGTPASVRRQAGRGRVRVALDWDATTSYLFYDSPEYVRYDQAKDRAGAPTKVDERTWPGLSKWLPKVRAGFSRDRKVAFFFLDDGTYLRYDKVADRVGDGYPLRITDSTWPGLAPYASRIRTALRWKGSKVFLFLDNDHYLRYDVDADRVDPGYPMQVDEHTWPGLRAHVADIETAMKWNDSRAFMFLKGNRYLRYDITNDRVDAGPRPVNDDSWPGVLRP